MTENAYAHHAHTHPHGHDHGHRPRTPEAQRTRRWFMNMSLLPGGGGMGGPGGTPTQQRIHTIIRTPNGGDYGIDLLRLHLENDH